MGLDYIGKTNRIFLNFFSLPLVRGDTESSLADVRFSEEEELLATGCL